MKSNVVFLNSTDNFPVSFSANNSKNELIAKGLLQENHKVSIINKASGHSTLNFTHGQINNIKYYLFPEAKNAILGMKNIICQIKILFRLKAKSKNIAIMCYDWTPLFMFYIVISKILGYKTLLLITEWHRFFEVKNPLRRIDFLVFDSLIGYFVSGVLPISSYIYTKMAAQNKHLFKIPLLCEPDKTIVIDQTKRLDGDYFIYCGHIGYFEVIDFILEAFNLLNQKKVHLVLVLSGPDNKIEELKSSIALSHASGTIIIEQKLPFELLMQRYKESIASLIPLRNYGQDIARFPNKVGEALAVGTPIVSTNVGEIRQYFTDKLNAFLCEEYDLVSYSSKMKYIIDNRNVARKVGNAGKELASAKFNHKTISGSFSQFISDL